jgi:hypothetical protein
MAIMRIEKVQNIIQPDPDLHRLTSRNYCSNIQNNILKNRRPAYEKPTVKPKQTHYEKDLYFEMPLAKINSEVFSGGISQFEL